MSTIPRIRSKCVRYCEHQHNIWHQIDFCDRHATQKFGVLECDVRRRYFVMVVNFVKKVSRICCLRTTLLM
jgi:hypothetical protein